MQPDVGTTVSTNGPSGHPARHCRDCGVELTAFRLYCDRHRDLRRIVTFLHQARLIAETSEVYVEPLAGQIRHVIAEAEGLR